MNLALTPAQSAELSRLMRHDAVLLGRVDRAQFTGTNAETSGALHLVFTSIPVERLAQVRAAITAEPIKPRKKAKR